MSTPAVGERTSAPAATATTDRERIRQRLQERRDLGSHVVAYVVINAFLIAAWWFTGGGYFWPAWVLAAWGAGLVLHAWSAFVSHPVTEADVDAEMRRVLR